MSTNASVHGGRRPRRLVELAVDGQLGAVRDRRRSAAARTARPPNRARRCWPCEVSGSADSSPPRIAPVNPDFTMCLRRVEPSPIRDSPWAERRPLPRPPAVGDTPAALRAQHEERVVERVAGRRARREHRDAQHALHGPAGARIHDVRIGHASGLERLLGAAGHRERAVLQREPCSAILPRVDRILNRDVPPVASRRRAEPVDAAAAGADQRGRDADAACSSATTRSTA